MCGHLWGGIYNQLMFSSAVEVGIVEEENIFRFSTRLDETILRIEAKSFENICLLRKYIQKIRNQT